MAEKIEHLYRFEDDRGELYLFDLNKINLHKISKSVKVYFGEHIFTSKILTDTFLICIQGKLTVSRLDTLKNIILSENSSYQLENTSYDLSSSDNSLFVEIVLSHISDRKHDNHYNGQVTSSAMKLEEGIIDMSSTLKDLNFGVRRLFYIKNVAKGKIRGDHSHSSCAEIMMAIKGGFTLTENNEKTYLLDNSFKSYLIPADTLTKESDFSEDAICFVLANTTYDPSGYY